MPPLLRLCCCYCDCDSLPNLPPRYELVGGTTLACDDLCEVFEKLAEGEQRKHKSATAMNDRSSRAHTVLMMSLVQRRKGAVLRSTLHLVDLGGSEQIKKSKAEGERLKEAVDINKSLMTLGSVVDALVTNKSHVPYYESKLTMLLQPALGGNARTTVMVTAAPEKEFADETVAAMRFGERAAGVQNTSTQATASMAEVLRSMDAAIAASETTIAELEGRGAAEKAREELGDAKLRGMGYGHAENSRLKSQNHADGVTGADGQAATEAVLSTKQATAAVGTYTFVDDIAGKWMIEKDRLALLQGRRRELVGRR